MDQEINLKAEKILSIHVQCGDSMDTKEGPQGYLAVIPITGGTFEGKISGKVIPGGADWNMRQKNGGHAFAKYVLQADSGEYIAIENEGYIAQGQDAVIATVPRFTADENGAYGWLNYGVYVGSLQAGIQPGQVEIIIYKML